MYREVATQPKEARLDASRLGRLRDQPAVAEECYPMAAARQAEQEIDQRDLPTAPLGRTVVCDDSQRCFLLARHGKTLFTLRSVDRVPAGGYPICDVPKCLGRSNTLAGHRVPEPL